MELYLVRHTTPAVDFALCYGQTDLDVAEHFSDEVNSIRSRLPNDFDAVYSSPLKRCSKLANALTEGLVHYDSRLMEIHFGEWEMTAWSSISRRELDEWVSDLEHHTPPKGESLGQLYSRVNLFLDEVVQLPYSRVLISTHGGVLRCALARVLQMPIRNIFKYKLRYGDIFLYHYNADSKLETIRQV